jgi:hypothetical protein
MAALHIDEPWKENVCAKDRKQRDQPVWMVHNFMLWKGNFCDDSSHQIQMIIPDDGEALPRLDY